MSVAPTVPQTPEQTQGTVPQAAPVVKFGTATKLFGSPSTPAQPVANPATQLDTKSMLDIAASAQNVPSKDAVKQQILDSGYRQQIDDINAQQYELAKQLTAPMTDIYADPAVANNP